MELKTENSGQNKIWRIERIKKKTLRIENSEQRIENNRENNRE